MASRIRWVLPLIGALLVLRLFVLGLIDVRTSSMAPTIEAGEVWVYRKAVSVGPGDMVVVRLPDDPNVLHVKRIVAAGGQEVELSEGRLYVDGKRVGRDLLKEVAWRNTDCIVERDRLLEESYEARQWQVIAGGTHERMRVDSGHFWLLGDNRGSSSDSRHWGQVEEKRIVGRLWRRITSRDRCGEGS